MSIILDVMTTLFNSKQKEKECQQDYTKKFWVACDVPELHIGGPIILKKVMQLMPAYSKNNYPKVKKQIVQAFSQFLGYLYLENADGSKYGSILTGLNAQQLLIVGQQPISKIDHESKQCIIHALVWQARIQSLN